MNDTTARRPTGRLGTAAAWTGLVLMLFPLYWFIASGLLAPLWAIVGLLLLWALAVLWGLRYRRRHPWIVLAMPFVLMAVWIGVMTAGEQLLGWTV